MTYPPASVDRNAFFASKESRLVFTVIASILTYILLSFFDVLPDTLDRALWEAFVRFTPSQVVFFWDKMALRSGGSDTQRFTKAHFGDTQAKSEALRRLLGLDRRPFIATFQRARSFSGIGNIFAGGKANSAPPGLGNWDNSCYQNSVIQGLASLPSIEGFIDDSLRIAGMKEKFVTQHALKSVINDLNDTENYGRRIWTPADLKSMSSWQQQDAQEYFSKIVDEMDKEARRALRGRPSTGFSASIQPTSQTAPFSNPLEGLIAQRVGCMRCGYSEGLSLIPFNCLTVPLGRNWEYDVRDCLDEYTALEPIEGVECANCTLREVKDQLERLLQQADKSSETQELGRGVPSATQDPSTPAADPPKHRNDSDRSSTLSPEFNTSLKSRLDAVKGALDDNDFSEITLSKKCNIPSKNRVSSTKSRQAVIARAPKSLVIHINRSLFDEMTGAQRKNYADVRFPETLDFNEWCLGAPPSDSNSAEKWIMDPSKSMLSATPGVPKGDFSSQSADTENKQSWKPSYIYRLRAVVTHYGRHENGHYIAYRKRPWYPSDTPDIPSSKPDKQKSPEQWFRFSDDDVSRVSEGQVLSQGGVFMLFYELKDQFVEPKSTTSLSPSSETIVTRETSQTAPSSVPAETQPTDAELSPSPSSTSKDQIEPAGSEQAKPRKSSDDGSEPPPSSSKPTPVTPVMRTSGVGQVDTRRRSTNFLSSTRVVSAL